MRYTLLLLLFLAGCVVYDDVEVVAVFDDETCAQGKRTLLDTERYGRIQRCGYWGKVGEKFKFNVHAL